MKSGYDGEKIKMHPTNIKNEFGYLGMNEIIIDVWGEQNIVFQEGEVQSV